MTFLNRLPLSRKLLLMMLATSAVAVLVVSGFFLSYDIISLRRNLTDHLSGLADVAGDNSAAALTYRDPKSAEVVLRSFKDEPQIEAAYVLRPTGEVFASFERDAIRGKVRPADLPAHGNQFDADRVTVCRPIVFDGDNIGMACIRSDLEQINKRVRTYLLFVLLFLLVSFLAAYLVAILLKRFVSKPVFDLVRTAQTISTRGNYSMRAVKHAGDELGVLVDSFNKMLGEIEKRDSILKAEVSARTRMNEELESARLAAEAASRAKSEFLANMSHEIRTPMNGVLGMTELALDTDLTAEQREYLETVKISADALMTVVNDILDFSKIESGRLDVNPAEFVIEEQLSAIMKNLAIRAHQKGLELLCEVDSEVPPTLIADPYRMRQVLMNIVGNAVKFTDRGEVALFVGIKSRTGSEVELLFSVRDTGIGIPPEKQGLIFRPFEQADGSFTRKFGGTGLGLTISQRVVEALGGRLWLESRPGKGSTFSFTLPTEVPGESAVPAREPAPKHLEGARVLIVDDNANSSRILQSMLRRWGMVVTSAATPAEALVLIQAATKLRRPYQLLLLDADARDGEAVLYLAPLVEGCGPDCRSVALITANGAHAVRGLVRELHIGASILKPVSRAELEQAVFPLLGKLEPGNARPLIPTAASSSEGLQRILVAEDHAVNQQLAANILRREGFEVELVSSGQQAVAAVESKAFDVVLMDVQMPDMDGLEATRKIRELEKDTQRHVPIVALTAHAMSGDRERCLAAGMDGYLSKPLHANDLLDAVRSFCPTDSHADLGSGVLPQVPAPPDVQSPAP
jgi:two-component system, sensor histidine kinase and response regulator